MLQVGEFIDDVESKEVKLSYPLTLHPETMGTIVLAGAIADPTLDKEDYVLESKAIRLHYFLEAGSLSKIQRYCEHQL